MIARKEPDRHPRVAARWLLRYLEEDDEATIDELVFAASCLAALTGNRYLEEAQALKDMTEKATRRRRGRGVEVSTIEPSEQTCPKGRLN